MSAFVDNTLLTYRRLNALGFLTCVGAIGFAVVYLQGELGQTPCPLCSGIRIIILAIAAIFLLALLHNPGVVGQRIYGSCNLLLVLLGSAANIRQLWLGAQPALGDNCSTGLALLEKLPGIQDGLSLLGPQGECLDLQWQFMGLNIPEQNLAVFAVLVLLVGRILRKKPRSRNLFL